MTKEQLTERRDLFKGMAEAARSAARKDRESHNDFRARQQEEAAKRYEAQVAELERQLRILPSP